MEITIKRIYENEFETAGKLYIYGRFICYTLEPGGNEPKILGKTRIPSGQYPLLEKLFGKKAEKYIQNYRLSGMPWLGNVPGFTDVYIHTGNTVADTSGCILVGDRLVMGCKSGAERLALSYSRSAFKRLCQIIERCRLDTSEILKVTVI